MTARGLFISKKSDAMEVRVLDDKTGLSVFPDQEFKGGDRLRIEIQTNFEGYVYIINLEIANKNTNRFLLFPNPNESNKPKADEPIVLPTTFDETPAIEIVQVIASHDRIGFLDSVLKGPSCSRDENRCKLDQMTAKRVADLLGDTKSSSSQEIGGVFSKSGEQQKKDGMRPRGIILSQGKDKEDKSSYVAIPIDDSGTGRLKSGQLFAFEIRLKHL